MKAHPDDLPPFFILTGPTAVGKTALSLDLADRLGAEIISADSRQVYQRLTIGTAKPTATERARARHHFIDELELDEPFSAGRFAEEANRRIADILERGKVPLVVGGSTLYLYALQFGLADIPDVDPAYRREVEARLNAEGAETLYRELERIDPRAAATLDATKTQRLVRALEVYEATGRPLSSFQDETPVPPYRYRTIVLHRTRAELYSRINARVDEMLQAGLLDEVRAVLDAGYRPTINALRTIGYREPIAYLRGRIDYDEMVRTLKRNTRRYAKRQLTWFRRFESFEWCPASVSVFSLCNNGLR